MIVYGGTMFYLKADILKSLSLHILHTKCFSCQLQCREGPKNETEMALLAKDALSPPCGGAPPEWEPLNSFAFLP